MLWRNMEEFKEKRGSPWGCSSRPWVRFIPKIPPTTAPDPRAKAPISIIRDILGAGSREQGAGSRERGAGSREQGAGSRAESTEHRAGKARST